ncbi:DNA polymerase III, delta prime subunit [Oscillochloris trichoides DG-6]|uniref:DNA polymerase III subunit delta' n=1 Tax=Oscillochloris trichoides DG-6 TaxID=765420 RepID=E1IIS0_9CHLR|nr:DNA polymerase III subunit delta' [Oscillochloris trichoides]EFO78926.1 DNA polymerase III, delta prime subunit [Oscillochloris trichoides DG-6]
MPWTITGHAWAVHQLQHSIQAGTDAHAYLFSGPAGLGKALLALQMAQALNCEVTPGVPCQECRSCRRIARGNHPDVRIAGMASQGAALKADEAARQKELKIATIREWQRDISLRPYEARRRVLILHDAERLNEESSNAMLKTLEEPPDYATIILVANSTDLLPTIVSRCRVLRLRPLPRRQVADALIARHIVAAEAEMLAAWSYGRIGWALDAIANPERITARQEQLDALLALDGHGRAAGLRWAEQRAKEYRNGEQESVFGWLELWQGWWRDVLLVATGCDASVVNIDRRHELNKIAARHSLPIIHSFVQRIGTCAQQLRENGNPQLVLENVVLHHP